MPDQPTPPVPDLAGKEITLTGPAIGWYGKEGKLLVWDGGDLATVTVNEVDMGWGEGKLGHNIKLTLPARQVQLKGAKHWIGHEEQEEEEEVPSQAEVPPELAEDPVSHEAPKQPDEAPDQEQGRTAAPEEAKESKEKPTEVPAHLLGQAKKGKGGRSGGSGPTPASQ